MIGVLLIFKAKNALENLTLYSGCDKIRNFLKIEYKILNYGK